MSTLATIARKELRTYFLARDSGGYHDHVGTRGLVVAVRSGDSTIVAFDGSSFHQIQRFTLRHALNDIDENNIAQLLFGHQLRCRRSDVAGAYHGNFSSSHYIFSTIACANSEVFSFVALSIKRSRS